MMLVVLLLWLLYEDWLAKRKLEAHIRATSGAQIAAAELAMQFQREQFERSAAHGIIDLRQMQLAAVREPGR